MEKVSCWDCQTEMKRIDALTWYCPKCEQMWKLFKFYDGDKIKIV
jgi:Zn finger protein HypA/HybF involved in hydrogenase expression